MQEAELYTDFVLCGCRFLNLTGGKKYNFCMFLSASEKNMLFFGAKSENRLNWQILEACTQQKFGHGKIFVFPQAVMTLVKLWDIFSSTLTGYNKIL